MVYLMLSEKGSVLVFILIGVLVVTGLAGGAYLFGKRTTLAPSPTLSPTPDETTDWKTYSNTVYGYSISYPSGWSVITGVNCQMDTSVATARDSWICLTPHPLPLTADQVSGKDFQGTIDKQNKFQAISIRIYIKPTGISSHDYFKQYIVAAAQSHGGTLSNLPKETTPLLKKNNSSLDITTDEENGPCYSPPCNSPNVYTKAYITRGSQDAILIDLQAQQIDSQLAYQIFSTFKYTDSNPVTSGNGDFAAIQQALAKYDNLPIQQLVTTVNKAPDIYNGSFATGDVSDVGAAGGGIWTAAKVNNQWKIAFTGNGSPLESECEKIKQYNLPKDLNPCR